MRAKRKLKTKAVPGVKKVLRVESNVAAKDPVPQPPPNDDKPNIPQLFLADGSLVTVPCPLQIIDIKDPDESGTIVLKISDTRTWVLCTVNPKYTNLFM